MEDRIPGWLHHYHKMYCEKGDCCERQALIVDKECTMEICFPDE